LMLANNWSTFTPLIIFSGAIVLSSLLVVIGYHQPGVILP
jgi:hypothetical protein